MVEGDFGRDGPNRDGWRVRGSGRSPVGVGVVEPSVGREGCRTNRSRPCRTLMDLVLTRRLVVASTNKYFNVGFSLSLLFINISSRRRDGRPTLRRYTSVVS